MREKLRGGLGYPGVTTSELKVRDAKRGKRRDGGRGVVKHGKGKMMDFQVCCNAVVEFLPWV